MLGTFYRSYAGHSVKQGGNSALDGGCRSNSVGYNEPFLYGLIYFLAIIVYMSPFDSTIASSVVSHSKKYAIADNITKFPRWDRAPLYLYHF